MREKDFDLEAFLLTLTQGSNLEEISTALQPFTSYILAVENSSRLRVFPSPEHLPSLTPVSTHGRGKVYRSAEGKDLFLPSLADRRDSNPPASSDRRDSNPPASSDKKILSWKGDGKLPFWPKQSPSANEPQKAGRKKIEEKEDSIIPATAMQEEYRSYSTERIFPQAGKKESAESTWEIRNI